MGSTIAAGAFASVSALAGVAFGVGGFTGWHALRQPWLMSLVG